MKLFSKCYFVLLSICFSTLPLIGQVQVDSLQELLNKKEYAKMIILAANLTAEDSTSYNVMYALGQAYDGMLRYKAAYNYYDICYRMDTTNVDILNILARSAINIGKAEDAERFFLKVLEADTLSFYANNQLAGFYYQSGEYDKALSIYKRLLDIDEENPALLTAIGNCYTRMEMPLYAISNYLQAFNHTPENVPLASTLINSILNVGKEHFEIALEVCDTALYYNPNNRRLLQNKGMALYANERYKEADTIYTKLMAAGDSTYNTLKYGGLSRFHVGQFVNAIEPLEIAYLMDTTSVDVCLYLGSTLGQTYDRKRAFVLYDKAEKMMNPPAYKLLLGSFRADTYRRDGETKIAYQLYYRLWKEFPKRMDILSQIYMMNDRYPFDYDQPEAQQIALFIQVIFTKALSDLQREDNDYFLYTMRVRLQKVYDEMIFREVNSLPMLAPDGEKRSITMEELRTLIGKLPSEKPPGS